MIVSGRVIAVCAVLFWALPAQAPAQAQVPPGDADYAAYTGLHAAAAKGDVAAIARLGADKSLLNARDGHGRTPLMVAAHARRHAAAAALIAAGADLDALDRDRYDVVTIASVADDVEMLKIAIAAGANPGQTTSPYDGTALIAAAHLGHVGVVKTLIAAGAPLDHVNNLNWTALIESIVLGDGGANHVACLKALVDAGANVNIPDGSGVSPLGLAQRRGFGEMVKILKAAGAE
tara:strand:+ start:5827 stop:6528 length:702 start_codon:yes stop_codon:yes gene_type:complete